MTDGPPIISTYSQKAYPFDKPVALSLTKLKALRGPNDVSNSFTYKMYLNVIESKYIKYTVTIVAGFVI